MNDKEQVIKKFHPDPLYFIAFYFLGILFIVFSFFFMVYLSAVGFFIIVLGEIARRAETFYILNDGVAREYKLFSTSREFCEYEKIQNLQVNQSFFNNVLGIGNVRMDTAGSNKTEVNFHGVRDPYKIESTIREKMV
jgi:uncharacterized membrane protein YdbT with pleckstrin-like domain